MATFTSIKEYRNTMMKRFNKMKNMESPMKAAKIMVTKAKRYAPIKTGETIRGIRARKNKKSKSGQGAIVESIVSSKGKTGFRQNMWANRTPPHDKPRMWWNGYEPVVYGNLTKTAWGNPINWSGRPQFFHIASMEIAKKFLHLVVKELNRIYRSV